MNNRREQMGWYVYDWANSAFYTTVVTVFLGPYLTGVARAAAESSAPENLFVYPLGIKVFYGSFFPYVVALSVGLQLVFLPILGAIADYSHRKKQMLALFAYLGSLATMGLYFLHGTNYLLGGSLFILANLSYGHRSCSTIRFCLILPLKRSAIAFSSIGWAIGYLGADYCLL
jgi:UMF1 family MFS transporter